MKKNFIYLFLISILFSTLLLTSCRIKAHDWKEDGCNWICDNPYIIIYKSPIVENVNDVEYEFDGHFKKDDNLIKIICVQDNTLKKVYLLPYLTKKTYNIEEESIFMAKVRLNDNYMYWDIYYSVYETYANSTLTFYKA